MPVNLTFASRAYDDSNLFRYAYAFATASKARQASSRTPFLESKFVAFNDDSHPIGQSVPELGASAHVLRDGDLWRLELSGSYNADDCNGLKSLQAYVDGRGVEDISIDGHVWKATVEGYCTVNGNPEEKAIPPSDGHCGCVR